MTDEKSVQEVVIVGGSLSGLLCGILLKRLGHNVTILEQAPSDVRESQAAGIGLTDQVRKLFETARVPLDDIGPAVEKIHFYESVNSKLEIKKVIPYSGVLTAWNVLYYRLRAHFDGFTSSVCPQRAPQPSDNPNDGEAVYQTGKRVTSVEYLKSEKVVLIQYDDLHTNSSHSLKTKLLIGADGGNSIVRTLLYPRPVPRKYAGFFAWRGTFPRNQLSPLGKEVFAPGIGPMCGNATEHTYVVTYLIPSENGNFGLDEGLVNFVWYDHCPANSSTYAKSMTDVDGNFHRYTLPPGKMDPAAWAVQRAKASKVLPPPFDEMADKISHRPFITAVTDMMTPDCVFFDGHAVLVGEAFCVARPHTGQATNEAARQALLLGDVLQGKISWTQYRAEVMGKVRLNFYFSRVFGLWYLGSRFARWWAAIQFWWIKLQYRFSSKL